MKFWDSSARVPLLVPEAMSRRLQRLYRGLARTIVAGVRQVAGGVDGRH